MRVMFLLFWYYIAILSIVFWLCFLTHYVTIQCTTEGRTSKLMDQTTAKKNTKYTSSINGALSWPPTTSTCIMYIVKPHTSNYSKKISSESYVFVFNIYFKDSRHATFWKNSFNFKRPTILFFGRLPTSPWSRFLVVVPLQTFVSFHES